MSDSHDGGEKPPSDRPRNRPKAGRFIYDDPSADPRGSLHWKRITRGAEPEGPVRERGWSCHEHLLRSFRAAVDGIGQGTREMPIHSASDCLESEGEKYEAVAFWSCAIGYCEALATHRDAGRRRSFFPVPERTIRDLVDGEFLPLLRQAKADALDAGPSPKGKEGESLHRRTVRAVANAVWKRARARSGSVRDELHSNGLYSCLCGDVDGKGLDCFGAALLCVVGMNILGFDGSCLTLSEDHAYESHPENVERRKGETPNDAASGADGTSRGDRATCEVAVPGNTKAARSKRGREISYTFEYNKRPHIDAGSSWLYMGNRPVLCDSPGTVMAALVANINCDIDKQKPGADGGRPHVVSKPLYRMKRDMLWILHDAGYLERFPFALMELGECEEHLSSPKGLEWVDGGGMRVLRNERLFLDAIAVSRSRYADGQVYPYLYAAHYHRDAGRDDGDEEYRLVESVRLYSEAARVASRYRYDAKDCLQLMKHFTTVASLIAKDVLTRPRQDDGRDARTWRSADNAVAAATWLVGFYDSLLLWEEKERNAFVEILSARHKHCPGRLFQFLAEDVRVRAIARIRAADEGPGGAASAITKEALPYFGGPRSRRLAEGSLLAAALTRRKVVVRDLEMALPSDGEGRSARRRKRSRT